MKNLALFFLFVPIVAFSQPNVLNAFGPEEIGDNYEASLLPLEYEFVSDKDVLFSKTIWEEISLDERVNFPMYFPVDTTVVGNERRPLIHHLYTAVLSGEIENIYEQDNLKDKKSIDKLSRQLIYRKIRDGSDNNLIGKARINTFNGKIPFIESYNVVVPDSLIQFESDYNSGLFESMSVKKQDSLYNDWEDSLNDIIFENKLLTDEEFSVEKFEYQDVVDYKLKGIWYFNKRIGELRYRPIAICPIIKIPKEKDANPDNPDTFEMFWVYFPDARYILHEAHAFNDKNTSKPITFDHLINSRRFSGFIYKEDNVYEDRDIKGYISENALMQLLESQRIKEKLRNLEQDMWSY